MHRLAKQADALDKAGLHKEADAITAVIRSAVAQNFLMDPDPIGDGYNANGDREYQETEAREDYEHEHPGDEEESWTHEDLKGLMMPCPPGCEKCRAEANAKESINPNLLAMAANQLDDAGLFREANVLTNILIKIAQSTGGPIKPFNPGDPALSRGVPDLGLGLGEGEEEFVKVQRPPVAPVAPMAAPRPPSLSDLDNSRDEDYLNDYEKPEPEFPELEGLFTNPGRTY